jgi:hypothetical protein
MSGANAGSVLSKAKAIAFAEIYNDQTNYPTIKDVAKELGIATSSVRNRASEIRKHVAIGADLPEVIYRKKTSTHESPMSEEGKRFMESWDEQDCISELRRVQSLEPNKFITRNFFRTNTAITDSTWNRYFGTFEEFKKQAALELTRHQKRMERNIAKHASLDHYRDFNKEKMGYEEKYVRDKGGRFKTVVACSDIHDIECDPFYLKVFIDTCKRVQPDVVAITGDLFDLPEFSAYTNDPREWNVTGRIKFVHENVLKPLREVCPDSQIDLIEGNHEARLLKMVADSTPALREVLSDLHGMTVGSLLGLDKYEVNYIAKADLAAFTKREQSKELQNNYKIYYESMLAHHFPHARNMGLPGWNGHHHKHIVWSQFNHTFGAYEWHQMGSGHKRSASYCEGEVWNEGFLIANCDTLTKATAFDYIFVGDSFAVSGGKFYYRD